MKNVLEKTILYIRESKASKLNKIECALLLLGNIVLSAVMLLLHYSNRKYFDSASIHDMVNINVYIMNLGMMFVILYVMMFGYIFVYFKSNYSYDANNKTKFAKDYLNYSISVIHYNVAFANCFIGIVILLDCIANIIVKAEIYPLLYKAYLLFGLSMLIALIWSIDRKIVKTITLHIEELKDENEGESSII